MRWPPAPPWIPRGWLTWSPAASPSGGQFGLVGTVLILTAAAVAWHQRVWRPLLVPLAALAALNAATLALKLATGRTAPHAGIDLVFAGGWSYPSGHAVNATVCLPLLVAVGYRNARSGADRREWSPPGPAMAATAVAVAAVGLATVVLGYHWASDVAAGWLLGLAVVLPALRALRPPPASAARTRVSARPPAQARTEPQPRPEVTVAAAGPGCAARASAPRRCAGTPPLVFGVAPAQCRSRSTQTSTVAAGAAASTSECPATVPSRPSGSRTRVPRGGNVCPARRASGCWSALSRRTVRAVLSASGRGLGTGTDPAMPTGAAGRGTS